jgi:hypothetical protein
MNDPWFAASFAACLLSLVWAGTLRAGVVLVETWTANGPNGLTSSAQRRVYIQGNKQRIDEKGVTAVTDLDKSVVFLIDENDRVYSEMPLQEVGREQPENGLTDPVELSRSGETRVIAKRPCNEYRGKRGSDLVRESVSICVSTGTPGAKEVSDFERRMSARLSSRKAEGSTKDGLPALMLEKRTVVDVRLSDPLGQQPYRTARLTSRTRVDLIQVKQLPRATFEPPKGYSKVQNQPRQAVPADSPAAHDQNVAMEWPYMPCRRCVDAVDLHPASRERECNSSRSNPEF